MKPYTVKDISRCKSEAFFSSSFLSIRKSTYQIPRDGQCDDDARITHSSDRRLRTTSLDSPISMIVCKNLVWREQEHLLTNSEATLGLSYFAMYCAEHKSISGQAHPEFSALCFQSAKFVVSRNTETHGFFKQICSQMISIGVFFFFWYVYVAVQRTRGRYSECEAGILRLSAITERHICIRVVTSGLCTNYTLADKKRKASYTTP